MRHWRFIAVVGIFFSVAVNAAQIGLIKINGAIGPAAASYIARAIDAATDQKDECLIIQLDTPGGLVDSASEIVEKFYAAKIPTVVYVAPAPARAGSAGVFITMAADVAAKLKEPKSLQTATPSFEEVVKSAQEAAVLVLVY